MAEISCVKQVDISSLKLYDKNSKTHSESQIELIAKSIKEFGFLTPCLIDSDNNVVAGHGRIAAAKSIGMKEVPCVIAEGLTEAQRRAYVIADNKLTELGGWDKSLVGEELEFLENVGFDLDLTGFDIDDFRFDDDIGGWYGDERERTNNAYNLGIANETEMTNDFWQMPVIKDDGYIPAKMIGFNYAKTSKEKDVCVHFFIDDYQFERVWNYPEKYFDVLSQYDCILSPDFSLYMDMPMAMKIWNVYRSRMIGAYYQQSGIAVIPTISWAEPETYKFCFRGIPKGSTVAVSTVGVKESDEALSIWEDGMRAMIKDIKPKTILVYGGKLDFDYGDIKVIYYKNEVLEAWKNGR